MSETAELSIDDEWREWMEDTFNNALTDEVGIAVPQGLDTQPLFRAAMRAVGASWTYDDDTGWLVDRYEETIDHAAKMVRGAAPANWDAGNVVVALRATWEIADV
jgi:hypothetical protein